jgi:hypothetical protein
MTHGIKISCHKRELYVTLRNSNDPSLKHYYKIYCKILSNVINAAKNFIIIDSFLIPIIKLKLPGVS